jgi:uncharacterized protein (DUF58 family)
MDMQTSLPHPIGHPVRHVRERMRRFWLSRVSRRDTMQLTQRTVYILPTGPGFMLGATLLVLLVASINYQLNLGYLLTFLLAGSALVGMHLCHGTLRGLVLNLQTPSPGFANSSLPLGVWLVNERKRPRYGIGVSVLGAGQWSWTDVPGQGSATVHVAFLPTRRGLLELPALTAETRFPLGTFRVWTVWRPASRVLVYPTPEHRPPPLPPATARSAGNLARAHLLSGGETDGVRAYRRGDPLKLVVWKKAAKADELVSRDTEQAQRMELWLDLTQTGIRVDGVVHGPAVEQALSRLCAWVLAADKLGLDYGLRLQTVQIAPAHGDAQQRRCLEALALYGD